MTYDEHLADRVRQLLAGERGIAEQRMFGGLAFLVGGHMAVTVSRQGGIMVRVDPDEGDALLRRSHVRRVEMRGVSLDGWLRVDAEEMRGVSLDGWLRVDAEGLRTKRQLAPWVARGVEHARTLPPRR